MSHSEHQRCGYVAVVGRPNVGKSTLINRILGIKVSITSRRAQTTRHRILGIKTVPEGQIILVDTPGLHASEGRALSRYMNRAAVAALEGVDAIVMVCEALRWSDRDEYVWQRVRGLRVPVLLVVNKVDLVDDKSRLLPFLAECNAQARFAEVLPMSARRARDAARLQTVLLRYLPAGEPIFAEDQYTDRSERFLCAETIREKLIRLIGQEVPHRLAVEIRQLARERGRVQIDAEIWVETDGQKAIVIGRGGERLKRAGSEARRDLERLLAAHVHLELWVKVRSGWSDDRRRLSQLGYQD